MHIQKIVWCFVALLPLASLTHAQKDSSTVIKDVRIFTGEKVISEANVVIKGDKISAVGSDFRVPDEANIVKGDGRTLIPGLIDAHVHTNSAGQLRQSLALGVTTVLDMFTQPKLVKQWQSQQEKDQVQNRASIFSSGIVATAPGGHGTQYGMEIPTISSPEKADEFVSNRIAEGSDYIKIIYGGGGRLPVISEETLKALVEAAHAEDKLAVVHIETLQQAREAINAGADGLAHIFYDQEPGPKFVQLAAQTDTFVIPTLAVTKNLAGTSNAETFMSNSPLSSYLLPAAGKNIKRDIPMPDSARPSMQPAMKATQQLHEAGVPLLAGTDTPNPGTAFGISLYHELELLVEAGLSPTEVLESATLVPAKTFGLDQRGRIAPDMHADLLLVEGNPTSDITDTQQIVSVWKNGNRFDRSAYQKKVTKRHKAKAKKAPAPEALQDGSVLLNDFENGNLSTPFGTGWQKTTDSRMGGNSTAKLEIVEGGATESSHSLMISGTIGDKAQFAWSGAMFYPGSRQMAAVDLSAANGIHFSARAPDRTSYRLMLFTKEGGRKPSINRFTVGSKWKEYSFEWSDFGGSDGSGVRAIGIVGGPETGSYKLQIDQVTLND